MGEVLLAANIITNGTMIRAAARIAAIIIAVFWFCFFVCSILSSVAMLNTSLFYHSRIKKSINYGKVYNILSIYFAAASFAANFL
jgi:hypothetical protein